VPSYDLCPQVTLEVIAGQMQAAAWFLKARHGRLDLAIGHSAGGHLAAMLLADGLVPAALAISGLFDLRPLVKTTVNGALGLDEARAWRLSPRNRPRPAGAFHAVVGGREGREYAAQSRVMAAAWDGRCDVLPEHDHFTIVSELARDDSPIVAACRQMLAGIRNHEGGQ
jgi:arylformamidase